MARNYAESDTHDTHPAPVRSFDAAAHMRKIRTRQGMQDYLDVKWRVAWLRSEFPAAQILTEQISGDDVHARFKCTIALPNGAMATGHGSETQGDFPDFYEKAETKSVGRACAILGYGTDAASDFDDGEPMDGRAAAKDERSTRAVAPAASAASTPSDTNVTPITAPNRSRMQSAEPSELPATPRAMAPRRTASATSTSDAATAPANSATATIAAATPAGDDRSNVHQHAQLRTLAEHGFDLADRLTAMQVGGVEDLTREQAKELIIAGRSTTRGGLGLN